MSTTSASAVPDTLAGFHRERSVRARDADGNPVEAGWFAQSSLADIAIILARNAIKVDDSLPLHVLGLLTCGVLTGAGSIFNSLNVEPGAASVAVL